ncbi:MAG: fumarylacetoacetate hydrolase family protein [Hyphomicrobiales bacterium]|nr:fumarylacetoacetate hydrolase family protein [Hyphomicrobiales bacterium]
MKICRFDDNRIGLVEGDQVRDVTGVLDSLPPLKWPVPFGDHFIANLATLRPLMEKAAANAPSRPLSSVKLLSPVANPSKIVAAPLNYQDHIDESKDNAAITHGVHGTDYEGFDTPVDKYGLFLKGATGIVGAGEGVDLHWPERRNDHELELSIIIGEGGKNISRDDAMKHVAGYAIGLDMTVRGPEARSMRKAADSYSVLGPYLVTADEIDDPDNLDFEIRVGNEMRQKSNTKMLICDVRDLIVRASKIYRLFPGDIIMTGTPQGVNEVKAGNVMHCWIEKIGEMDVEVR